jgi:glucose/arabinose dehydrogenase
MYPPLKAAMSAALVALPVATATGAENTDGAHEWGARNVPEFEPMHPAQTRAPIEVSGYPLRTSIVASGLVHPWAVAELPDGAGYLVTERSGQLRHVTVDGQVSAPLGGVPQVENRAPKAKWPTQAGLLDVKLGPDFENTRHVYLTYAKPVGNDMSATAAARAVLSGDLTRIRDVEEIFVQEPASPTRMHYGSRIVFDGDGHAFITTGEHSSHPERAFAQQLDKTYGKVVRLGLDGSIPDDNPFVGDERADDAIWSYGHRNVQGAAVHDGFLYTMEHGPAGGDELNIPRPGHNYGWPVVSYGERYAGAAIGTGLPRMAGMQEPVYYWDPVIAPGDIVFYEGGMFPAWQGDLLSGALVAPGIVRLEIDGHAVRAEERLLTGFDRVRDVAVLEDGSLLLTTDEPDGALVRVTRATDVPSAR